MKTENEIIDILYKLYQDQGYVKEKDIFDLCDSNSLSFLATDHVCNQLQDLGVLISNDEKIQEKFKVEEEYKDYSQIDYSKVFDFFYKNYPQMRPIVDYIKSLPPPQKGENSNLIIQARSGNRFARKQVIEKNLRTALRIAMRYENKTSIPIDELFSVACEGLIIAVDSFDPYINTYFASYSSFWIMQKIDRYLTEHTFFFRFPVYLYDDLINVRRLAEERDSFNIPDEVFTMNYLKMFYKENKSLDWYDNLGDHFFLD